jgi:hypothetical protein
MRGRWCQRHPTLRASDDEMITCMGQVINPPVLVIVNLVSSDEE